MKICIYHNLKPGGALNEANEIINILSLNNEIHIYSHNRHLNPINCKLHIYPLNNTKNIIQHLYQAFFTLSKSERQIANSINSNKFDLILIFPCIIVQSPHLLKFIKNNYIYFFTEPKREFYEKTSYDHYSIKKIITRIIRYPIKIIDKTNCKKTKYIVTNSCYSSHILHKIYNKKGYVLYPGLSKITPIKINTINNQKIISIGQISKIKGHDFSIKQLLNTNQILDIIGRPTEDKKYIEKLCKKINIKVNFIETENDIEKIKLLKKYSIYLSNQNKEPFGISTLEACDNKCFVVGKNEGGTSEIISHGLNGYLYPSSGNVNNVLLQKTINKKMLTFYKMNRINWQETTRSLLRLYHFIKNEPNE